MPSYRLVAPCTLVTDDGKVRDFRTPRQLITLSEAEAAQCGDAVVLLGGGEPESAEGSEASNGDAPAADGQPAQIVNDPPAGGDDAAPESAPAAASSAERRRAAKEQKADGEAVGQ